MSKIINKIHLFFLVMLLIINALIRCFYFVNLQSIWGLSFPHTYYFVIVTVWDNMWKEECNGSLFLPETNQQLCPKLNKTSFFHSILFSLYQLEISGSGGCFCQNWTDLSQHSRVESPPSGSSGSYASLPSSGHTLLPKHSFFCYIVNPFCVNSPI